MNLCVIYNYVYILQGKKLADDNDDVDDDGGDDESTESDENRDMGAMTHVFHCGPKIRD